MRSLRVPPPLSPGSRVRVVAPCSPFDPRLIWRGMGWLAQRYRVDYSRGIFAASGFLAGDDGRRREELQAALDEPDLDAILCARGGYGLSRYVHQLDLSTMVERPRWLVGFSDVTALHVELASAGVASMHACNVTALGRSDAQSRDDLVAALESPTARRSFEGLEVLSSGQAEGPLYGGNLTLLQACAAAGRLRVPDSAVILLEDVSEMPYRVDRALTTLLVGGHFDAASAIVVGELTGCRPGVDGVRVEQVIAERLAPLGIPVVAGAPVGHGRINRPVIIGAPTRVEGGRVTFFTRRSPAGS